MVAKPISLRPSSEEKEIIDRYMKTNKIKKPSLAVKQIIRTFATLQNQLEQKEKLPQKTFSPLDKKQATGHLIKCPLMNLPIPYEEPFTMWNPPVDTSVCKSCPSYPCETWLDIESINRVSKGKDPLVNSIIDSPSHVVQTSGSHNPRP